MEEAKETEEDTKDKTYQKRDFSPDRWEQFENLTEMQKKKRLATMVERMEEREGKYQDLKTIKSELENADKWYDERLHYLKLQHPNVPEKLLPVIGNLHKLASTRDPPDGEDSDNDDYDVANFWRHTENAKCQQNVQSIKIISLILGTTWL